MEQHGCGRELQQIVLTGVAAVAISWADGWCWCVPSSSNIAVSVTLHTSKWMTDCSIS
jgi:hypothetical protein